MSLTRRRTCWKANVLKHDLCTQQNLPDVTEVEISPSGEWRLPGSEGRWHSITEDPADALAASSIGIKPDPEQGGAGGGSDSEELSEAEELRRAAAAATASTARARAAPEVIVLDSDSDEERGLPASAVRCPLTKADQCCACHCCSP